MFKFFKSEFFNFEYVRVLSTIPWGGGEIGECLEVASQIKEDDPESWHSAWLSQAKKAEALAHEAEESGDAVAARDGYLRASNYFRASQYMFNDRPESPNPRVLSLFNKSLTCFQSAIKYIEHDVRSLEIPYEKDYKLPGYLFLPHPNKRLPGKIPILINCNGADSTSEELYSLYPAAGCDRGYAVVSFDGPGQGLTLRQDGLRMRPDWEVVTSSVLDHLFDVVESHPELEILDLDRIAIAGASMGAYYALRGAADPRVKACVSVDPFYDMFDLASSRMPPWFISAWLGGWLSDGFFNGTWAFLAKFAYQLKWELTHVMWIFGKPSAALGMREMQHYTLRIGRDKEYLSRVECPVLVTGAAGTIYTPPEISTDKIYATLQHLPEGKRQRWVAKEPGQGGLQAKIGAWRLVQQKTFRFLDEQLKVERPGKMANGSTRK